jgi:hypothetical protein
VESSCEFGIDVLTRIIPNGLESVPASNCEINIKLEHRYVVLQPPRILPR